MKKKIDVSVLGKASDSEVAKKFGVGLSTVRDRRRKLGIPAFNGGRPSRIEIPEELLGRISDGKIAEQIGCSKATVRSRREELNISPVVERKRTKTSQVFEEPCDTHFSICLPQKIIHKIKKKTNHNEWLRQIIKENL